MNLSQCEVWTVLAEAHDSSDEDGRRWQDVDDSRLIAGMKRGHFGAFAELYRRYAPLLTRMARRRKVPEIDRQDLIMDYLEDVLIPVLRGKQAAPEPLGNYLAAGFRRRMISAWRSRQVQDRRVQSLRVTSSDPRERVVAEGLSEYAFRAAAGPANDIRAGGSGANAPVDATGDARAGLARVLDDAMSADERQLMGVVAENFPQREIAAAMGIEPIAARVRIHRLRERMMKVSAIYIAGLPVEEGKLLAGFLGTPRALRMKGASAIRKDNRHRGGSTA
jgi:RNA polymerase sigma factor (sigma-70 family)